MKRDIFIDNNIACRFTNPADQNYKDLIQWLMDNHTVAKGSDDDRAILVVSKKLIGEYSASCRGAKGNTSIPTIIETLMRQGRLFMIKNDEIKTFINEYFTKKVEKDFLSNNEDRHHIPVVLLSDRKYAITNDDNFTHDLRTFPGFKVLVSDRPEKIPYSK